MLTRYKNSIDAAGTTMAKRTKEESANYVAKSSATVDDADLSKFIAKLRDSKLASFEDFLVTLRPVKSDCIVKSVKAMANVLDRVKQKELAESKLIPNEDPNKIPHASSVTVRWQTKGV